MSFVCCRREVTAADMPDGKIAARHGAKTLVKGFAYTVEPPQIPVNGFAALFDRELRDFDHQGAPRTGPLRVCPHISAMGDVWPYAPRSLSRPSRSRSVCLRSPPPGIRTSAE